jgi:hypothetical protein
VSSLGAEYRETIDELKRSLWAVRLLDRWVAGLKHRRELYQNKQDDCRYLVLGFLTTSDREDNDIHVCVFRGEGPDLDYARIAAAKALVAEDPSLGEGL